MEKPSGRSGFLEESLFWYATVIAGLIFFSVYIYSAHISLPFLADDYCNIYRCETHPGIKSLEFLMPGFYFRLYRPVAQFSFCGLYGIFRLRPAGYHIFSLSLHFINALLLFAFMIRMSGTSYKRHMALCVFGVWFFFINGRQHDSVMWPSALNELLCACFGMASLLLILRHTKTGNALWHWLSLVLMLLCLGSKETGLAYLTLAIFFILMIRPERATFRSLLKRSGPLFLMLAAYVCLYIYRSMGVKGPVLSPSLKNFPGLISDAALRVAGSIIPMKLDMEQIEFSLSALTHHAWIITLVIIVVSIIVIMSRNTLLLAAFGGVILTSIPNALFTSIHPSGDRLFYSISIFTLLFIIVAAGIISRRIKNNASALAFAGAAAALLILGIVLQARLLEKNLKMREEAGKWAERMIRENLNHLKVNTPPEEGTIYWVGSPRLYERTYVLGACLKQTLNLRISESIIKDVKIVSFLEKRSGKILHSLNPELEAEVPPDNAIIFLFDGRKARRISKEELVFFLNVGRDQLMQKRDNLNE